MVEARATATPGAGALRPGWALIVAAAVVATWASALGGSFQFDDWNVIVDEPRVASLPAWWASMPGIRPLLKLTYAAGREAGLGYDGFLAVNVAIHVASAILVLVLLGWVAARTGTARTAAFIGALLFALHPVQAEAVTYASGRSASLSGALALASAVAWVSGRERGGPWLSLAASPTLFAMALAVKESVVALPLALVLLLAVQARRPLRVREAIRATAPHWAVLTAGVGLYAASPVYRRMLAASATLRNPAETALTHLEALGWLAGQMVRIDQLSADPGLATVTRPGPATVAAAVALVAALAAGLAWLRTRPAVAFGILWFLVWLPPAGFLLPRPDPASDRQLYLSLAGAAWLAGVALAPWVAAGGVRRLAVAGLVVALGGATVVRNRAWRDEEAFWADVVEKAPGNARAQANLGFALATRCRTAEAEAALLRALDLDPGLVRAAVNLRLLREGAPLRPSAPACPPPSSPP